jgi:gamma-glutamyl phosphate reductase
MKSSPSMIDRITLNKDRINGMVSCLDEIINLKDPTGIVLSEWIDPMVCISKKFQSLLELLALFMNQGQM